jgi:hypothetical protein
MEDTEETAPEEEEAQYDDTDSSDGWASLSVFEVTSNTIVGLLL